MKFETISKRQGSGFIAKLIYALDSDGPLFHTEDNSRANCFIHHSWKMWPGERRLHRVATGAENFSRCFF